MTFFCLRIHFFQTFTSVPENVAEPVLEKGPVPDGNETMAAPINEEITTTVIPESEFKKLNFSLKQNAVVFSN